MHDRLPTPLVRAVERLRESMWLYPSLAGVAALVGSIVLTQYEERTGTLPGITHDPDTARSVLSTAATTTITFAGLVFSITLLALQLTSSQFSPRALRQFLRAREGQVALALFVGTFVFEMITLGQIRNVGEVLFVPAASTTIGVGLAVLSLAGFVGFVHHMTQAIRAVNIIETIAIEARACADSLDRSEEQLPASEVLRGRVRSSATSRTKPGAVLQYLDHRGLAAVGQGRGSVLRLRYRLGDFVPCGAEVIEEWIPAGREHEPLDWETVEDHLVFGRERTMTGDIAFGYRQLVDIAEKALSPGINDPTTAVQAVDRIHDLLRTELGRPGVSSSYLDDDHCGLFWSPARVEDLIALSFNEIRRYGSGDLQVLGAVFHAVDDLIDVAPPEHVDALRDVRRRYEEAAERNLDDPIDLTDVTVNRPRDAPDPVPNQR